MRIIALLMLASAILCTRVAALAAQPPSDAMAHVGTFIAVTEGRSGVNLDTLFTQDAVVIDESAPYVWRGPHAASSWMAHVNGILAARHMRNFTAIAGVPIEYSQNRDLAYLIVPLTLSASASPRGFRETGALTFTLRKIAGDWKFSTATWTTATRAQ